MSLIVWRISHKEYTSTALIGEAYNRSRGRWNSKGTTLMYTSATLSLACLPNELISFSSFSFSTFHWLFP